MANKIAINSWIYNNFGVGKTDAQAPTKSVIQNYGLGVTGAYASNQLVKEESIYSPLVSIPVYVMIQGLTFDANSYPVYVSGEGPKVVSALNLQIQDAVISMDNGSSGLFYVNTSQDQAGGEQYMDALSNCELDYSTENGWLVSNRCYFGIPTGTIIKSIELRSINLWAYYGHYYLIQGDTDTSYMYRLKFRFKIENVWRTPNQIWRDKYYGSYITGVGMGAGTETTIDMSPDSLSLYYLDTYTLQAVGIYIERYTNSGDNSSM